MLEDDKHYFPPYDAVPVVRLRTLQQHPELATALSELAGKISESEMQKLNYAVDGEHQDVTDVVRSFLRMKHLMP